MRLPDGNNGVRVPGLFRERMIVVYITDMLGDEVFDLVAGEIIDRKKLAGHLLARAKEQSVSLVEPGGGSAELAHQGSCSGIL